MKSGKNFAITAKLDIRRPLDSQGPFSCPIALLKKKGGGGGGGVHTSSFHSDHTPLSLPCREPPSSLLRPVFLPAPQSCTLPDQCPGSYHRSLSPSRALHPCLSPPAASPDHVVLPTPQQPTARVAAAVGAHFCHRRALVHSVRARSPLPILAVPCTSLSHVLPLQYD